jgi:hypothetical protein
MMFGDLGGGEIMTKTLVLRELQVGLADWGLADTGSPGVWSAKLGSALKSYQQERKYPYLTTKPEYWTIYDIVEPRIGEPTFDIWSRIYQEATGKTPNAGVWQVQFALRQLKFNPGPVDGLSGTQTTNAIKLWQKMHAFPQTGVLLPTQVSVLGAEVAEEKLLGTLLVTAEIPSDTLIETIDPAVSFEDPPEVVEAIIEAQAAGVPITVREDRAVTEPKVVVEREPTTQKIISVTKLIPATPPKPVNPWVWVGVSAASVVAVGGIIALVVRAVGASAATAAVAGLGAYEEDPRDAHLRRVGRMMRVKVRQRSEPMLSKREKRQRKGGRKGRHAQAWREEQ